MNAKHDTSRLCVRCKQDTVLPPLRAIDPQILHSGYALSDSEVDEMMRILEVEEHEREQVELAIDRTRQLLEMLEQRKRELEVNIGHRRSTFSVLRRIPTEIWENIFTELCSSTPTGYSLTIDLSQLPAVLDSPAIVVSQVCSRWQSIARGCPELWTSMSIQLSSIFGCHRMISAFLVNSRGHLLIVRVQEHEIDRVSEAGVAIWAELSGHLWRCRRLTLDVTDLRVLRPTDVQELSFPNLTIYEELLNQSTQAWDEGWTLTDDWRKALKAAPRLTDVTLCFLHTLTTLPYSQLTRLKLRRLSPLEIQKLPQTLSVCHKLVTLKLGCFDDVSLTRAAGYRLDPVEVPTLRELVIEDCHKTLNIHSDLLSHLLHSLLLPSLDTLDLRCTGLTMYRGWPPALLDMLHRVSQTLRHLSLYINYCILPTSPYTEPSLASALLNTFPELEVLQIAMERDRHANEIQFQAHADFFVQEICVELGNSRSKSSPLPKIVDVSLFMSSISLDSRSLGIALDATKAPSGAVDYEADANQGCSPKILRKLSISRFPFPNYHRKVGRPKPVQLALVLKEKITNLEREGLKVIIQDLDGSPEELQSVV